MSLAAESAAALFGCARILRRDVGGLAYFNATEQGFWRSFTAAFALAPFYALLTLINLGPDKSLLRVIPVEISAYVIGWVTFPLVMVGLTRFLDRREHYFGYMVAYNWFRIAQALVLVPMALFSPLDALPQVAAAFIGSALLLLMMSYDWFIARHALRLDGVAASGLVVIDFILSLFISQIARALA